MKLPEKIYHWSIKSYKQWLELYEKWYRSVDWNVDFSNQHISKIEKFPEIIKWDLYLNGNNIKSLEWITKHILWCFICRNNFLTTTKYLPIVDYWIDLSKNLIQELEDFNNQKFKYPIILSYNKLKTLKWLPSRISWDLDASYNNLTNFL